MPKTPTKKELTPREKMLLKLESLKKLFENTSVVSVDSNIKQIPWSEKLKEKILYWDSKLNVSEFENYK
jgi:hypothetical protein